MISSTLNGTNTAINTSSAPFYKVIGREVEVFEHAYKNKIPLMLKGPTGSGKSRFVEYMAHQLESRLMTISCHEETSATDLVGRFLIKGAETVWMDGPLTQAVKDGHILYLDEIAEARPDVIVAIHSLTDHRRELYVDKLGASYTAAKGFMLVASFNPGYQRGYKELKPSTLQRFSAISFGYPTPDVETLILTNETGLDENTAKKLVIIANKIRNLKELGLTETISTRLLVNAGKMIHSGLPPRTAMRAAMVEPLTDEPELVQSLSDLCNLVL